MQQQRDVNLSPIYHQWESGPYVVGLLRRYTESALKNKTSLDSHVVNVESCKHSEDESFGCLHRQCLAIVVVDSGRIAPILRFSQAETLWANRNVGPNWPFLLD